MRVLKIFVNQKALIRTFHTSTRTQIHKVILYSKTGFKGSFKRFLERKKRTLIWYEEFN